MEIKIPWELGEEAWRASQRFFYSPCSCCAPNPNWDCFGCDGSGTIAKTALVPEKVTIDAVDAHISSDGKLIYYIFVKQPPSDYCVRVVTNYLHKTEAECKAFCTKRNEEDGTAYLLDPIVE